MARYVETIPTSWSPAATFEYMARVEHFQEWDPGVVSSKQVAGDGPGPGSEYDVEVKAVRGSMTLRYRVLTYDAPNRLVIEAASRMLVSRDTVVVTPTETGSAMTYEATLNLRGPLGVADVALRPFFNRIASRAGAGLRNVLASEERT